MDKQKEQEKVKIIYADTEKEANNIEILNNLVDFWQETEV